MYKRKEENEAKKKKKKSDRQTDRQTRTARDKELNSNARKEK